MPLDVAKRIDTEAPASREQIGDLRFRKLLRAADWQALPLPVRQRFSKRVGPGDSVVYVGEITEMRMSRAGWWLAQIARFAGAPLPVSVETGVPAVVTVTEDAAAGGQVWTRLYASRHGFPQVINSAKRFQGATGLEEHVGAGIGMSLRVGVRDGAIVFESDAYFASFAGLRLTLPRWLTPGDLEVMHAELGQGRFAFSLRIVHPLLGELLYQRGVFADAPA